MLIMALSSVAFSGLGRLHVWTVYLDTTVLSFNSLIVFLNFLGGGDTLQVKLYQFIYFTAETFIDEKHFRFSSLCASLARQAIEWGRYDVILVIDKVSLVDAGALCK